MIHVTRLGFMGVDDHDYDGPERALEVALRHFAANGHVIISVSVLRSTRAAERYEAFVVHSLPEFQTV